MTTSHITSHSLPSKIQESPKYWKPLKDKKDIMTPKISTPHMELITLPIKLRIMNGLDLQVLIADSTDQNIDQVPISLRIKPNTKQTTNRNQYRRKAEFYLQRAGEIALDIGQALINWKERLNIM